MDWLIYDWVLNPRAVEHLFLGLGCWWFDIGRWFVVGGIFLIWGSMALSGFMGVENGQDSV